MKKCFMIFMVALICLVSSQGLFASEKIKKINISSDFGWRINPITKQPQFHPGIDIAAKLGTPIVAFEEGKVVYIGWYKGFGWIVRLKHKDDVISQYGHLSLYVKNVVKGSVVKKGQIIGCVGSSGMSTGPHLDFRLFKNNAWLNPYEYFLKRQQIKNLESSKIAMAAAKEKPVSSIVKNDGKRSKG